MTALVVALASVVYAIYDVRSRADERRAAFDREGRALATTVRASLESGRPLSDAALRDLARTTGWRVVVIPAARAAGPAGSDVTDAQLRRLRTMLEVPQQVYAELDGDSYIEALPVRAAPSLDAPGDPKLVSMLELAHSADNLGATDGDIGRAAALVVVVVLATIVVVGVASSRLVSRPITKLLRGIDDVAKGDLSHVILSERDDEIGAIATRFNDMTFVAARVARGDVAPERGQARARAAARPDREARDDRPARRRDRARGRHAAQRDRRARARDPAQGARSRGGREERRDRRRADRAHHAHHPAPARLHAPQGRRPRARGRSPRRARVDDARAARRSVLERRG